MKRPIYIAILLFLVVGPAMADHWIPYTDGRSGGCFQNQNGNLFGCTPQPIRQQPSAAPSVAPSVIYRDRQDPRIDELESENQNLRAERYHESAAEQAAAAANSRRLEILRAHFEAIDRQAASDRAAKSQREWQLSQRGCDSPAYMLMLKKQGLKKHPSVAGICLRADSKPGHGAFFDCPKCS